MLALWIIGGSGNVATTVALGLAALRRRMTDPIGLVTELPSLAGVDLAALDRIVVGGCDLRSPDVLERARHMAVVDRIFPEPMIEALAADLADYAGSLQRGVDVRACTEDPAAALAAIQRELRDFAARAGVDRAIVVNLASTEAPWSGEVPADADGLRRRVEAGGALPPSSLYAMACLDLGWGYINFTPSTGACLPGLDDLARARGAVHAGRDGKTGQTLLKTALAPMFAARHLRVLSWFGQNLLGNDDGRTLSDPEARRSKLRTKGEVLPAMLGYRPAGDIDIRYVEPLGDWKVAWDHILFEGFLGTRMTMTTTWHGADSALAAPLVIDLARLVDRALRRGERGLLSYLGLFFKEPLGASEQGHDRQAQLLIRHLVGGAS